MPLANSRFTFHAAIAVFAAGLITASASAVTLTTLTSFDTTTASSPQANLLADAAGNLYGTTRFGGINSLGTVFKVTAGTNALTILAEFNGDFGAYPVSTLIADGTGNLYGTTRNGGSSDNGTVFKVATGTNALSVLAEFNVANGQHPLAGLIADADGNLYGTTQQGGPVSFGDTWGTVFKVAAGTNALTSPVQFDYFFNGAYPQAGLIADADGNLYGTTAAGYTGGPFVGPSWGTVFKLDPDTNTLTTLAEFGGASGYPAGSLTFDAAGNLYGTTLAGGANGMGSVFKVAAGTNALTTLVDFDGANGTNPYADLIIDAAGNLYGTTYAGGLDNVGTVFKLDPDTNTLTTLVEFDVLFVNGFQPLGGLIADAAGNLYGTTSGGGVTGQGTVFQLSGTGFAVPEPSTFVLGIGALAGMGFVTLRKKFRRA